MKAVVRRIEFPKGRRVLCVSDIHGNLPLFKGVLAKAHFSRDDILMVLGDILERHEGSLDTLRYVMELSKTHTVYTLMGNCDNIVAAFMEERDLTDEFYDWWFQRLGEKATLVKMAHLAGARVDSPKDYPAARAAIREVFAPEVDFLCHLPQIYVNDDYLFVHGGVPREDNLEELDAYGCMKNDDFLGQGLSFQRWVVVGHWPVTLYREDIASAKPMLLHDRHIASIDGGCTLKADGQLNALILPQKPGGEFSYVAYDGFPVMTALDDQEPSENSINIRWGRSQLEVLKEGPEFCRCRHLESGWELDVLTEYLRYDEKGVHCEHSTDYRLPVKAGERLSVVRQTSRGALCKRDGATGWYFGRLRENGKERDTNGEF